MDTRFWTKHNLYKSIDGLLKHLNFTYNDYPLNSKEIAYKHCKNIQIEILDMKTFDVCGILYKGKTCTSIALNSIRSPEMQNFDCMHELIHYFLHDITFCQLICSDTKPALKQNSYIEWQANEGAAQFLVPYQLFIPLYVDLSRKHAKDWYNVDIEKELSSIFNVSIKTVINRIKNLRSEIYQYKQGASIDEIDIFSYRFLKANGLSNLTPNKLFCVNCFSTVDKNDMYCKICGNPMIKTNAFDFMRMEGVGYMTYLGIELDDDSKALICPKCENEEINEGEYCKICGTHIVNRCSFLEGYTDTNGNGNYYWVEPCGELADGNARYCHKCGEKTTFNINGLLEP